MTAQLKPNYHPCCNTMLRYTAGTLSPAMHLCVASHLTFCPQCRQELQAYESQAGLGLEALPPEQLDVSCLENLLHKIDESGPPACIDVTIPIASLTYRYPEALQPYVGEKGEHIRWDISGGISQWHITEYGPLTARIFKFNAAQDISNVALGKKSIVLVLDGGIDSAKLHFHCGDVIRGQTILAGAHAAGETLCLVVLPTCKDKPDWFSEIWSCLFGKK